MLVKIDKKGYYVNNNEFTKFDHQEFNNLRILKDVGTCERFASLLCEIRNIDTSIKNLICMKPRNGGFIPINCCTSFEKVILLEVDSTHKENIEKNIEQHKASNIYLNETLNEITRMANSYVIFEDEFVPSNLAYYKLLGQHLLVAKTNSYIIESGIYNNFFKLGDTNYSVFITYNYLSNFKEHFKYYIHNGNDTINDISGSISTNSMVLNYDNLIHLCIMVKNGGPQFEDMLNANIHLIDKWTILDTGSTDNTIEIINKVLVGKKQGELYQEPFINFRDSRNRCLDLAGKSCKFILTLDDTYIIKNDLRKFLDTVRGDQFSDSFSLYINSGDSEYGSNRVIKSYTDLRYKHRIHEVINDKDNNNVFVPKQHAYILDERFDYMEERTNKRKELDLKFLEEEVEENPMEPRTYYYFAQTYKCMGNSEMAYKYYLKRAEFTNSGFIQERVDAVFEAARIANFELNKPWEECMRLYEKAFKIDESRPDALYFIGIHYYLKGDNATAYKYFKEGYKIGYPAHCQYSLKPTLSFYYLPKFLVDICFKEKDFKLGEEVALFFLQNNPQTAEEYDVIMGWYQIFVKLNKCPPKSKPQNTDDKPILAFIADGGFNKWSGSSILTIGVGGSETYIIEMARHIQRHGYYNVIVFCHCEQEEIFEGVQYKNLDGVFDYLYSHIVETCIVSRFSEYIPAVLNSYAENVFLVVHDLSVSGLIIQTDPKFKKIFCLTEWHAEHFSKIFPILKEKVIPFYYGIDFKKFGNDSGIQKIPYKFIYSSFPNRGLSILLSMWDKIYKREPRATLHIYADVDGKWANDVAPEEMRDIRSMLSLYSQRENGWGVRYHGWVDKKTLADSWISADIWFYPCKFAETFCLTALEAALTKTLAITNDLAALQNTVGDRGVVIKGDATTKEWQDSALEKIFEYIDSENSCKKDILIQKNYAWASKLSWENQANKLVNEHLIEDIKYRGLFNWTNDLPSGSKTDFLNMISYFNNKNIGNPRILEIGVYAGTSLINILNLIPKSNAVAIDKWSNYIERQKADANRMTYIEETKIEKSFYENILKSGLQNRVSCIKGDSSEILLYMAKNKEKFDFIYVDGSHKCLDAYMDLVLSWEILNRGGVIMIDDYLFKTTEIECDPLDRPFGAVNRFLELKEKEMRILHKGYRVCVEKI
jgi:predicted O-methyltransferase YrrM